MFCKQEWGADSEQLTTIDMDVDQIFIYFKVDCAGKMSAVSSENKDFCTRNVFIKKSSSNFGDESRKLTSYT